MNNQNKVSGQFIQNTLAQIKNNLNAVNNQQSDNEKLAALCGVVEDQRFIISYFKSINSGDLNRCVSDLKYGTKSFVGDRNRYILDILEFVQSIIRDEEIRASCLNDN